MPMLQEIDYGTPAVTAEAMVTLTIDGQRGHRAGRHVHHARLDGSRHQGSEAVRH